MQWSRTRARIPTWHLRAEALEDQVFRKVVGASITQYFGDNEGPTSTPLVEWDTFKAVIRCRSIAEMVGVHRVLLAEVAEVEQRLRDVEKDRPGRPDKQPELLEAREAVAGQVEQLRCFDYKAYLTRTHVEGDKSGALLAWLANPSRRGTPILEIRDDRGNARFTQEGINKLFYDFYRELYRSKTASTGDDL